VIEIDMNDIEKTIAQDGDSEKQSLVYAWSRGQLKLRRKQLTSLGNKSKRLAVKAALYTGRAALAAHSAHAASMVAKMEGLVNKLEKINEGSAPKVQ